MEPSPTRTTIDWLQHLQAARAAGYTSPFLTTDPTWLVNMAINRRAGWAEDPHYRGAINAPRMPRKALGGEERHLRQLADRINTPCLIVRETELGTWRKELVARLPERFYGPDDF